MMGMATIINWHSFFFLLFAVMACFFALAVLFSGNIVRMAFYLIISLGATAGLFFLAGAHFVGAMQIMIYVGGTLVLLVFGVMLTAQATFVSMKTRGGEWILAAVVGGSLLFLLLQTAMSVDEWRQPTSGPETMAAAADARSSTTQLGMGLIGVRVDKLSQADDRLRQGMSGYLLPFEIVSVHLLVVLVGAAYLARAKRRVPRPDEPGYESAASQ
jgi:NADH-quinone oxidoreductase subunit J